MYLTQVDHPSWHRDISQTSVCIPKCILFRSIILRGTAEIAKIEHKLVCVSQNVSQVDLSCHDLSLSLASSIASYYLVSPLQLPSLLHSKLLYFNQVAHLKWRPAGTSSHQGIRADRAVEILGFQPQKYMNRMGIRGRF
jgi:hypothetical protein